MANKYMIKCSTFLAIEEVINQNDIEIPCHRSENGHQEKKCWQRCKKKGILSPVTIEISMEVPQKPKNRSTI
jgi:hypothetical protein